MADLDDITQKEHEKLNAAQAPVEEGGLEKAVKKEEEKKPLLYRMVRDAVKFSPFFALNFYMGGISSLITPIGLLLGRIIENNRLKKRTTWTEVRKEIGTGNFVGNLAFWAYSIPELLGLSTATLGGKILRTLSFNPGMLIPYVALYRTTTYIRDNIGTRKAIFGFFNFKIFKYIKEAYQNDLKKRYVPDMTKTFKTLAPIHFFSLNYITSIPTRVGIGAVNDVIFRLITGVKKDKDKYKATFKERMYNAGRGIDSFFRVPEYKPNYGGSYK